MCTSAQKMPKMRKQLYGKLKWSYKSEKNFCKNYGTIPSININEPNRGLEANDGWEHLLRQ